MFTISAIHLYLCAVFHPFWLWSGSKLHFIDPLFIYYTLPFIHQGGSIYMLYLPWLIHVSGSFIAKRIDGIEWIYPSPCLIVTWSLLNIRGFTMDSLWAFSFLIANFWHVSMISVNGCTGRELSRLFLFSYKDHNFWF